MRHRTPALLLAASLLLGGCGTVTDEAGGTATPSTWPTDSAAPADSPTVAASSPEATTGSPTPTPSVGAGGVAKHKPRTPKTHHHTTHRSAPDAPDIPAGVTARCNDGTFSRARHHQGACSHHHGVAEFYR